VLCGDPVSTPTTYPIAPRDFVLLLCRLVQPLTGFDRIAVGFPGMVRHGEVLTAPHFVTVGGPGTPTRSDLAQEWSGFALADSLCEALNRPVTMANDAELHGAAVIAGVGVELVVTLGTGVGTGLFADGHLCPHLELAHHELRQGETYNQRLGEAARRRVGIEEWNRRVQVALAVLYDLIRYDHLWIGGGNAMHLTVDLGSSATVVDPAAALLGGAKLWDVRALSRA
jgi:polyphosphate glucokinase